MQGFGIQTKDINALIKEIENEIQDIEKDLNKNITVIKNKVEFCASKLAQINAELEVTKEYTEAELTKFRLRIKALEDQISDIKSNINVIDSREIGGNTYAVGIAPSSYYSAHHSTYPIYATLAEKDVSGRDIVNTYYDKSASVSATSAMYEAKNKEKVAQVQAITGLMRVKEHQLILGF